MKTCYDIIKSLVRTEKGTDLEKLNQYLFEVDSRANKIEIKQSIEEIYKVKVKRVNTLFVRGKLRRVRQQQGSTSAWKKAIVTLKEGDKIEVT